MVLLMNIICLWLKKRESLGSHVFVCVGKSVKVRACVHRLIARLPLSSSIRVQYVKVSAVKYELIKSYQYGTLAGKAKL